MSFSRIVIVVAGNAGHGKDTLADMLQGLIEGARRDSYAAPLKECVSLKTGIPLRILNTPALKEDPRFGRYGKTPRLLMQEEGQEARERLGATVWADRALDRAKRAYERVTIISDGRHPDEEVVGMRERSGSETLVTAVRILRPDRPIKRGHPSEDKIADAPDDLFDYVVVNEGSIEDLAANALQLADAVVLRAMTGKKRPKGWGVVNQKGERVGWPCATEEEADTMVKTVIGGSVVTLAFDRIEQP